MINITLYFSESNAIQPDGCTFFSKLNIRPADLMTFILLS